MIASAVTDLPQPDSPTTATISPPAMRPGGDAIRRMTLSAVTDLPQPDSPTTPSVCLRGISKLTRSTARTTPCSVRNSVTRSRIASSASDTRPNIACGRTCYHIGMRPSVLILLLALLAGCPHKYKRSYQEPKLDEIMAALEAKQDAIRSFKTTDTTMDYWIGKDRFRGTVLVMGETGAKMRMNALRPDDAVAADLACDGTNFVYVDQMNNCVLTGPCTVDSIAALLRVPLAPDDFLYLSLGATPIIAGATGTVQWDAKHGREVVVLAGDGGMTQRIELDGRDGKKTWDVMRSQVSGPDGKPIWTVDHTDYRDVDGHRVPGKTHMTTPAEKSDLLVEWGKEREINIELAPEAFVLEPPDVPMCGAK